MGVLRLSTQREADAWAGLELFCRGFGGGPFGRRFSGWFDSRLGWSSRGRFFLGDFGEDLDSDAGGDFAVQADGNLEVAQTLDGVAELDLAAIDLEALRGQIR